MQYIDSVTANYIKYQYRLVGVDAFTDKSLPAISKITMGVDRTPPPMPAEAEATIVNDNQVLLKWKNPEPSGDLSKILISISPYAEGYFEKIHEMKFNKTVQNFGYKLSELNGGGLYFKITGVDTAGNWNEIITYCAFPDKTPPATPVGLSATVNKTGIVEIRWRANHEPDLDGYMLFTSASLKTDFAGLVNTPNFDTVFYDTLALNMLNKDVYYRVIAVDRHFNRSKATEPVKVLRPDTIRPVAPVIHDFTAKPGAVVLKWYNSTSTDVQHNTLYRIDPVNKNPQRLMITVKDTMYTDTVVKGKQQYIYFLQTTDKSGNMSAESNRIYVTVPESNAIPPVKISFLSYDTTTRRLTINWTEKAASGDQWIVYRGTDKSNLQQIAILPWNRNSYEDRDLQRSSHYVYALVKTTTNFKRSLLTEFKEIDTL